MIIENTTLDFINVEFFYNKKTLYHNPNEVQRFIFLTQIYFFDLDLFLCTRNHLNERLEPVFEYKITF